MEIWSKFHKFEPKNHVNFWLVAIGGCASEMPQLVECPKIWCPDDYGTYIKKLPRRYSVFSIKNFRYEPDQIWQNRVAWCKKFDIFKVVWEKLWPGWSIKFCFYASTIRYWLEEHILSYFIVIYLKNQGKFWPKFRIFDWLLGWGCAS